MPCGAPDQQQQIFQDQEGREGHERGHDLVLVVEVLQQQPFEDEADQQADGESGKRS